MRLDMHEWCRFVLLLLLILRSRQEQCMRDILHVIAMMRWLVDLMTATSKSLQLGLDVFHCLLDESLLLCVQLVLVQVTIATARVAAAVSKAIAVWFMLLLEVGNHSHCVASCIIEINEIYHSNCTVDDPKNG